jgi:hypothetical protein
VKIIRGKHRGKTAKIHQFANNWISADIDGGGPAILSPLHVKLSTLEVSLIMKGRDTGKAGYFWQRWALRTDGTFCQIPRGMQGARPLFISMDEA